MHLFHCKPGNCHIQNGIVCASAEGFGTWYDDALGNHDTIYICTCSTSMYKFFDWIDTDTTFFLTNYSTTLPPGFSVEYSFYLVHSQSKQTWTLHACGEVYHRYNVNDSIQTFHTYMSKDITDVLQTLPKDTLVKIQTPVDKPRLTNPG
jgi:hypothetical protein